MSIDRLPLFSDDTDRQQIIFDLEYRIQMAWKRILRETSEARAKRPVGNSRSIVLEFADLTEIAKAAVDESWNYALDICHARELRPEVLVPRAAAAIAFIAQRVQDYATERAVAASAFGESNQINAAGKQAVGAIAQHIDVTTRGASLGYAAGKAVYPKQQWPLTRQEIVNNKVRSAGIFLSGTVAGGIVTKIIDWFFG